MMTDAEVVTRLKAGEYGGMDIMRAWIAIEDRTALLEQLRAFHLDLSEVVIGADLDYQVDRLAELIKKYGGDNDS